MSLRDRMYLLTSPLEVDEFLVQFPTCALFKAGACHKTNMGFMQVEKALDARESVNLGFIRAVDNAPVADYVASWTGIAHQAPQIILVVDSKPVFSADHWHISHQAFAFALQRHLGCLPGEVPLPTISQKDVASFCSVLQGLVTDQLTDDAFQQQWRALPRENVALQGLLQEMDDALCCGDRCSSGGCSALPMVQRKRATLKAKAGQLLSLLSF